jgi:hypothetical protein
MLKILDGIRKLIAGILAAACGMYAFWMIPEATRGSNFPILLAFLAACFSVYSYFNKKEHEARNGGH